MANSEWWLLEAAGAVQMEGSLKCGDFVFSTGMGHEKVLTTSNK